MVNVNRKGESVGAFYGYQSQGIVRERHLLYTPPYNGTRLQEGDIKFIDKDGDGNVTEKDGPSSAIPIRRTATGSRRARRGAT